MARARRRPGRPRLPDQDAAGVPGPAGPRAGLPAVRADARWRHAARPPAGRLRLDAARGRLVDRDRRAVAGLGSRPYIGGSQNNSILELTLGYNGLGRLTGNETGSVGGGGARSGGWGATGLLRLFNTEIGGQIAWLLPAALVLGAGSLWFARRATAGCSPGSSLWGGWLLVTGADLQLHGRHLPRLLHRRPRSGDRRPRRHRRLRPLAAPRRRLVATAAAGLRDGVHLDAGVRPCSTAAPTSLPWLKWVVAGASAWSPPSALAAVRHLPRRVGLAVGRRRPSSPRSPAPRRTPLATAATPHTGSIPSAGPRGVRRRSAAVPGGGRAAPGGQAPRRAGRRGRPAARATARRPAQRQHVERRGHRPAADGRDVLHLGGRGRRLEHAAGYQLASRAAGDGDRRLQRQRPEPDARAVPGSTSPTARSTGSSPAAAGRWVGGGGGDAAADLAEIATWVEANFTATDRRRRHPLRPLRRDPVSALVQPASPVAARPTGRRDRSTWSSRCTTRRSRSPRSVARVLRRTCDTLPWTFRVTIADNASTDGTAAGRPTGWPHADDRGVGGPPGREGPGPGAQAGLERVGRATCSSTWTSTCPPTSPRCCRWSRRWSAGTPTSRSGPG